VAPRKGVMLHYDDSSRDDWAVEWFFDKRCKNGYTWLVLDDGRVVELADPMKRTPHAGACRTPNANSVFYGIAAATNGLVSATPAQLDSIIALCAALQLPRWSKGRPHRRAEGPRADHRRRRRSPEGADSLGGEGNDLKYFLTSLAIVLALCIAWRERELTRERERSRTSALLADSIQAARDTSRAVLLSVAGDSVRVYQRRIVQSRQRSDSLDRALGVERAARYRIAAEVTELRTQIAARVTAGADSVRSATFRARDGPFYIDAAVTLPPPPGDGRMTVRVSVDTAVIEARVGCGPADGAGVSPATLNLAGPRWMTLRLGPLEQDPQVCSPVTPRTEQRRSLAGLFARRMRIGVGYGAVLTADGRVIRGPVVSAIWSVWP
jgi:hypothetical protein